MQEAFMKTYLPNYFWKVLRTFSYDAIIEGSPPSHCKQPLQLAD